MTQPPAPWQLTIVTTITRKVQAKTEKEWHQFQMQTTPVFSDKL